MMRTVQDRIGKLHSRVKELERKRAGRQLAGLGSASAVLAATLVFIVREMAGSSESVTVDQFTGSSLLSDSVGGYVLAAVAAFFVGVIITAVIFRCRRR